MIKRSMRFAAWVGVLSCSVSGAGAFAAEEAKPAAEEAKPATEPETEAQKPRDPVLNIQVHPFALLGGQLEMAADFRIASSGFTIGPTLSTGEYGSALGVGANYYFSGNAIQQGWLFKPAFSYVSASGVKGLMGGGTFNYQWNWQSGFNMTAGAGAAYISIDAEDLMVGLSAAGVAPILNFSMGWAF